MGVARTELGLSAFIALASLVGGHATATEHNPLPPRMELGSLGSHDIPGLTIDWPSNKPIFSHELSGETSLRPDAGTTTQYQVFTKLASIVDMKEEEPYFDIMHDRLFKNPNPYFRIPHTIRSNKTYARIDCYYFQNGKYPFGEQIIPDVYISINYSDGEDFLGNVGVDLLIKPDGTLAGPTSSLDSVNPEQMSKDEIEQSIERFFILPKGLKFVKWDEESLENGVIKNKEFNNAIVFIGGLTDGRVFYYVEFIHPDHPRKPARV